MSVPGSRELVESVLDEYKDITINALLDYVPQAEPRRYLYDIVPSYPKRAGKGLRPTLCIATCRAFGGTIDHVLRSAVAIEFFHNAFLVHDDVEDGSEHRRGMPTLNAEFGTPIAVNVGDALNVLSIRPLIENVSLLGEAASLAVLEEIEHMVRQSVEGQALELGWVRDNSWRLSAHDYLRMTLKKTCWYTCIHPCRIGALIGSEGRADLAPFNLFGFNMGVAFQIQDDLLNLTADERYGKEIGGDIWEGKRTLMLIHLLNVCNRDERLELRRFLARPRTERTALDVEWVLQSMASYGSLEWAREVAEAFAQAALGRFDDAFGAAAEGPHKELVRAIVRYMIEREV
jgi:geranylgeranyl diphosphate synthase, type II